MLRITQSASSAAAKSYYVSSLDREDYYSEKQEIVGAWGGKLAEKLGLSGQVERDAFNQLCDNLNPATGERLTARNSAGRTVGYDFNFHCPKSVSVLFALSGDEKILAAFRASVRETMQDVEKDMQARVRVGGKDENRKTSNMLWGEFVHFTARPVGGVPDPHLHAHCYTFNATFDQTENKIKAGQFRELKRDASFYEAGFHTRLAGRLAALGYGIERTAQGWEVAGVSRSVIDKFSRRAAGIEKLAQEKGIVSNKAKDKLAARTREGKRAGQTFDALKEKWAAWLSGDESDALRRVKDLGQNSPEISDAGAVDYALSHAFERSSVVSERQIMALAMRQGVGSVLPETIQRETESRDNVITHDFGGQRLSTTKDIHAEEKAMLSAASRRRGSCKPLLVKAPALSSYLSDEQKNACLHVLGSRDGVTAIRGAAGVGKTSLMRETVQHIEQTGKQVFTFAPTANASRGVLRSEGFENADTLASLLNNKDKQDAIKNNVIWVDEAGQVGAKTMREVLELAEKQNARVVLSGDIRQHSSVERGDGLRLLETNGGLRSVEVLGIRRQKGAYREAVEHLSKGDATAGFDKLDALGAVVELGDGERYAALACDYAETIKAGKTALIVSPTHGEGEKVTSAVRLELLAGGKLGGDERNITRLRNLSWTEAERGDGKNYEVGLVVQFQRHSKGFAIGEKATVAGVENGAVVVKKPDGAKLALPLEQAARFNVYSPESLPLRSGDKIRIAQNGFCGGKGGKHRLNNGSVYEVAGFTKGGDIKLQNGWTVAKDFGHLSHGYCLTSHASQGATVDRVFIAQSSASARAASKQQFYVSASRGRESVKIYTDDKTALREAVGASSVRLSAVELMQTAKAKGTVAGAGAPSDWLGKEKKEKPKLWQMLKPAKDKTERKAQFIEQAQTVARFKNRARVLLARTAEKAKGKTKELVANFRQKALDRGKDRGLDYER